MIHIRKHQCVLSFFSFVFLGLSCLSVSAQTNIPGRYLNPDASAVRMPEYKGTSYEAFVPDTLDIAERARLSIHGLTHSTDPKDDYSVYWLVNFHNNPPLMKKETHPTMQYKFMESLPLLRLITNSEEQIEVDKVWLNQIPKMTGQDGLIYVKPHGTERFVRGGLISRLMNAMIIYSQLDPQGGWQARIEKMIDGLTKEVVDKGDWAYFGNPNHVPTGTTVDNAGSRFLEPLGRYYALTGYQPAKILGDKLLRYVRHHGEYFGPEGEWLIDQLDPEQYPDRAGDVHFGAHSHALLYMVEYGVQTKEKELLEYCRKS